MGIGLPEGHKLEYNKDFKREHKKGKYKYLSDGYKAPKIKEEKLKAFWYLSEAQYAEILGVLQSTISDYRKLNKDFGIKGSFNFYNDLKTNALPEYNEWFEKYSIRG